MFSTGDTISSTPNHPFFSEDKQGYLTVGDLSIGERVSLAGGNRAALLIAKWRRNKGPEKVYNLEVEYSHNFYVGREGVLVHNSCANTIEDYVRRVSGNPNWNFRKPLSLSSGTKPGCANCTKYTMHNGQKIYFDNNDFPVFEEFAGRGNGQVIRYDSPDLQGYASGVPSGADLTYASNWLDAAKSQYGSNIVVKSNNQVEIGGVLHTWHHHQNGKTMFLVPTAIHTVTHTGGGALIKYGLKGAMPDPIF